MPLTLEKLLQNLQKSQAITVPIAIMLRTYLPERFATEKGPEDTLLGYCRWDGTALIPEDYDSYSLQEEVSDYRIVSDCNGCKSLMVWIVTEWVSGEELQQALREYAKARAKQNGKTE